LKALRQYQIPFVGLKAGKHRFNFEIDEKFFANFDNSPVSKSKVKVEVDFDKKNDFFILDFYISGTIMAECDRCANSYQQELLDEFRIYVKFDDRNLNVESDDEDVVFISRAETHLDLSQLIYELVLLSIPMQKICAEKRNKNESCNPELDRYLIREESKQAKIEIDQRWSALEKLKKK
jgi:uncharacterized metal-binding protein YceD (DUF177 family)